MSDDRRPKDNLPQVRKSRPATPALPSVADDIVATWEPIAVFRQATLRAPDMATDITYIEVPAEPAKLVPVEPPARTAVPSKAKTKACPFCAERIKVEAMKCRFCGEFLDPALRQAAGQQGPNQSVVVNVGNVNTHEAPRIVQQRPPEFDHAPHIVLSVLTLGLWIPIWLLCFVCWVPPRQY